MQRYQLEIKANKRPEVLERLLRVIRHRGFEVCHLTAEVDENRVTVQVTVQSERERALLVHQLIKLPDVMDIQ
ncbi:acetolactate synthase 2 small subunit [Muribacter muris]|uniref:Acetolactate synthase 2 small subunit n=1 Tax=Muribacter muris TaxID=67855 RepID=A0A4Y9K4U9_9PAST|nr:acetolactate synthase 2 small subunit [Muribacter muris]MBF0784569.1 acetolactate synthase 2 small subunit [Muribacter muris]MBF0826135.1 acetolactate synthase 2 small subunit [Muribacter muris]TFV12080.1 acetolactate synthase 2 small subunit [Muribacter muris]